MRAEPDGLGPGDVLVLRGRVGYGEHHDESVFYVNEVIRRLPAATYRGWARAERRRSARARISRRGAVTPARQNR